MKKKVVLFVLLVALVAVGVFAQSTSNSVIGRYYTKNTNAEAWLYLYRDRTFNMKVSNIYGATVEEKGTYIVSGRALTITFSDGSTGAGTINGNAITLITSDGPLTLRKL